MVEANRMACQLLITLVAILHLRVMNCGVDHQEVS